MIHLELSMLGTAPISPLTFHYPSFVGLPILGQDWYPSQSQTSSINQLLGAFAQPWRSTMGLHYTPFRKFITQPSATGTDQVDHLTSDLISADVWWEEHDHVQKKIEVGRDGRLCALPCVIAGLVWWPNATQLANFGTAKLWPLYMFLGNQVKYPREKPSASYCYHMAYLPSVSFPHH